MRKLLSILCVSILLLNLFGFYVSFFVQRINIKNEMHTAVQKKEKHQLTRFVFSAAEFAALEKEDGGKEILMEGEMYDVKELKREGNAVIIYALHDPRETNLIRSLLSVFRTSSEKSSSQHSFITFIQQDFFNQPYAFLFFVPINFIPLYSLEEKLTSPVSSSPAPPPDFRFV